MKKLLLFTLIFSLIGITSCTKDEEHLEISQEEKELLVKQTIIEFNKSAIETGKFQQFMTSVPQKTASGQDVEALFQEFLGEQSQTFLDLYYQLEAINMTGEEFKSIADQYEYLRLDIGISLGKSSSGSCNYGELACAIKDWVTERGASN
ncbi:hypothetical protein [Aquimarina sp. 2304DJ70-9]|uniref:hypothetical protein n=1 Tax=Aquimarina penaris TaxID=3231044 RepID=UPI00346186FA